jgi:hypothetical protein
MTDSSPGTQCRVFKGHPSSTVAKAVVTLDADAKRIAMLVTCTSGKVLEAIAFDLRSRDLAIEISEAFNNIEDGDYEITLNAYLAESIIEWLRELRYP